MRKDIFIDNNIAKNFANPLDPDYQKLIKWLFNYDKSIQKENNAYLVLSQKIRNEYTESSSGAKSTSNITVIVSKLTKEGRINEFSKKQIQNFKEKHYKKDTVKKFNLTETNRDSNHLPIILMSDRKKALTIDKGFTVALLNFPKFKAEVESKPRAAFYR